MWFVLILVDKWFLLTSSVPDINRNLAVPVEVLLKKRGWLPLPLFLASAFLPGAHFPLPQKAQVRPQARLLSLSSLTLGHLVLASSQPFISC